MCPFIDRKHCEKKEKCYLPAFSPTIFWVFPRVVKNHGHVHVVKDESLQPKQQILDSSKLKDFADGNFKFDENGLFPQCFQETSTAGL